MNGTSVSNRTARTPAEPRRGRPPVENLRASLATTAVAVAQAAADDGVATRLHGNLVQAVQDAMWEPAYPEEAGTS